MLKQFFVVVLFLHETDAARGEGCGAKIIGVTANNSGIVDNSNNA